MGVGASAGGVEALSLFVAALPADLGAAVAIVLHVADRPTSVLPRILARNSVLPVLTAEDGAVLVPGSIHVAPGGRHLLVMHGRILLWAGPAEHGLRPAVDPLLRSLAEEFGAHAVGVVLSGTRDDGTAGLAQVKRSGGRALVQDPEEARYEGMPTSAIEHVAVDAVLDAAALAQLVGRLVARPEPVHDG